MVEHSAAAAGDTHPAGQKAGAATQAATIARLGSPSGIPACSACHGAAGEGNAAAGYPRLSGLDAGYLKRQLENFASGARSQPVMAPIAKMLDARERTALSAFYASLSPGGKALSQGQPTVQPAQNGLGARLALRGNWAKGVPACIQCHGSEGSGVGSTFPALAGQSSLYIRNQIAAWKSGTRAPGPLGLMAKIANKLSDTETTAVANYFAALPVARAGGTR